MWFELSETFDFITKIYQSCQELLQAKFTAPPCIVLNCWGIEFSLFIDCQSRSQWICHYWATYLLTGGDWAMAEISDVLTRRRTTRNIYKLKRPPCGRGLDIDYSNLAYGMTNLYFCHWLLSWKIQYISKCWQFVCKKSSRISQNPSDLQTFPAHKILLL